MATKKQDNRSTFYKELAAGAAKWRGVASKCGSKEAEEALEFAGAYEHMMHAFTAPKAEETKKP